MYSLGYGSSLLYALACKACELQLSSNASCPWIKSRCANTVEFRYTFLVLLRVALAEVLRNQDEAKSHRDWLDVSPPTKGGKSDWENCP